MIAHISIIAYENCNRKLYKLSLSINGRIFVSMNCCAMNCCAYEFLCLWIVVSMNFLSINWCFYELLYDLTWLRVGQQELPEDPGWLFSTPFCPAWKSLARQWFQLLYLLTGCLLGMRGCYLLVVHPASMLMICGAIKMVLPKWLGQQWSISLKTAIIWAQVATAQIISRRKGLLCRQPVYRYRSWNRWRAWDTHAGQIGRVILDPLVAPADQT